jgi:hypothetical protein
MAAPHNICVVIIVAFLNSCQGFRVKGNEGGSEAINEVEMFDMQKAVHRCHKNGGQRVVKIKGQLRCF